MHLTSKFLDAVARAEDRSSSPLTLMWPMPGNVGGRVLSFSAFAEWQAFVLDLGLRCAVPDIVAAKFERSQKLLLLAWIDLAGSPPRAGTGSVEQADRVVLTMTDAPAATPPEDQQRPILVA
jgi:hypothetical protein